jgi:2-polyprenyl-3-methyl-5-hydroxy-6-metoxy-1,4-benzoquinol methylase
MIRTAVSTTAEYTILDQERMKLASNYFDWQRRITLPHLGRRVLEIGCGMGNFTKHLADREHVVGIDVVEECIAAHRTNLGAHPHVHSLVMDVVDPRFLELENFHPDSIVCLNVLEHIGDDLQALRHMCAILPEGGHAVLIVPAFEALYGPIDRMLGHFRRYSKKSLRQTADAAGFAAESMHYMNSVGFFGWWVNAHILKRTEQSESQIALFDSKIVPLLEPLENFVKPPFGQSLFAVLVKRQV